MMIVVYFALLLMAVVALGSFGAKQADIDKLTRDINPDHTCILFAKHLGTDENGIKRIRLNSPGLCGYVLWGLVSITIVAFVWLIFSVVLAAIGPKM